MDVSTSTAGAKPLAFHVSLASPRARKSTIVTLDGHDLAEVLHITPATVWNSLSTNPDRLPPPVRVAGAAGVIWLESTVLAWLQERQVAAKATAPKRGRPTKRAQIEKAARTAAAGGGAS